MKVHKITLYVSDLEYEDTGKQVVEIIKQDISDCYAVSVGKIETRKDVEWHDDIFWNYQHTPSELDRKFNSLKK